MQQVVEDVLGRVLKEPVTVMGCGRTDAQVHASQFFFHLDVKKEWDFDLLFRANKMLPNDIAIFEIIPVLDNQHARFDATHRTYNYFIHLNKDPFLESTSSWYPSKKLDHDKMKEAVLFLLKYNDFRAFCKRPESYQHTICKISSAKLFMTASGDRLRFQISADRFLGRMVRLLVGKLLQIGKGGLSGYEFESYFATKKTPKFFDPAYPQGLFLSKVTYPYLDIAPLASMVSMEDNMWLEI